MKKNIFKREKSHYDYLDENFQKFANKAGVTISVIGLISAHGDKFSYYKPLFEEHRFEFWQGVAIGLLSYLNPWAKECRDTDEGFVKFEDWFVKNCEKFRPLFQNL